MFVAQRRTCSSSVVAVAMWFFYDEGAWRVPKPSDLFGPVAMTTHHTQAHADKLAWLEDWLVRKKLRPR